MAKKVLVPQDVIDQWKEMTLRASLSHYSNVNGILITNNEDNKVMMMIVPDKSLLKLLLEDKEVDIQNYDSTNPDTLTMSQWFDYGNDLSSETWLPISDVDKFYQGDAIEIQFPGHEFPILMSKELLPFKLKKSEFTDLAYRVFLNPPVLGIRKRFEIIPEHGFTVIRLFQVI